MGDEYESQPGEEWRDWACFMLDCGADIVVASHSHVLQPVEFIRIDSDDRGSRDCFIAYSTGNFLSSQREPSTDAGTIFNLYFERDESGRAFLSGASYIPTWVKFVDNNGDFDIRVLPAVDTLDAFDSGDAVALRESDIARLRQVLDEQTELFSVREPIGSERGEYFIYISE